MRYAIVVDGELPPTWKEWFGVDRLRQEGAHSVLEVVVTDQAQLHGILRRVHDLHLPLRSLRLIEEPEPLSGTRPLPGAEPLSGTRPPDPERLELEGEPGHESVGDGSGGDLVDGS
jgi:hypothetical protein